MKTTILLSEGDWHLKKYEGDDHVHINMEYWISHTCKTTPGVYREVTRFPLCVNEPCEFCGSRCPDKLQGMHNMMVYL